MTTAGLQRQFIEVMAKHLPPSGATLRLVDIEGRAWEVLAELRGDLDMVVKPLNADDWHLNPDSIDALVAFDVVPDADFLREALLALREGGRLIMLNAGGVADERHVRTLQEAGYSRILVAPGLEQPGPLGVLIRGEKPHSQARTEDRMKQIAAVDNALPARRPGRYVYLLVQQKPNKPAWKLKPGDKVEWYAVAVEGNDEQVVLAFSSLPKAVEFMQPVVKAGIIKDVHKMPKFAWEVARQWPFAVLLNPSDEIFRTQKVAFLAIDPATAEAPDE
jgi:SAM-dependent methyltransferase